MPAPRSAIITLGHVNQVCMTAGHTCIFKMLILGRPGCMLHLSLAVLLLLS